MTSCLTVFSISSMRATSAALNWKPSKALRSRLVVLRRHLAEADHRLAGGELDVEPDPEAALGRPDAGHLGARVAGDHAVSSWRPDLSGRPSIQRTGRSSRIRRRRRGRCRTVVRRPRASTRVTGATTSWAIRSPRAKLDGLLPEVHEDDPHLAPVVGVDGAGALTSAMPWRTASPERGRTCPSWPGGISRASPVGTSRRSPGASVQRLVGAQVQPGRAGGLVARGARGEPRDRPRVDRSAGHDDGHRLPTSLRRLGRGALGLLLGGLGERLLAARGGSSRRGRPR